MAKMFWGGPIAKPREWMRHGLCVWIVEASLEEIQAFIDADGAGYLWQLLSWMLCEWDYGPPHFAIRAADIVRDLEERHDDTPVKLLQELADGVTTEGWRLPRVAVERLPHKVVALFPKE
jgi:hypothetical protein